MIEHTDKVNPQQLHDLNKLIACCKKSDDSVPNTYPYILTQTRAFPASLFYYEHKKLLGFLSSYFFYEDAVEISILVHPKSRRIGIARLLIADIIPLIKLHNYHKVIISSPAEVNSTWLLSSGYSYLHREYAMTREELHPILNYETILTYRYATPEDIPSLCVLDEACFPNKKQDLPSRFQHMMSNRDYQIVMAFKESNFVGKAHIRWEKKGAILSDISINPAQQGKGLGSALIAHCINYALSEGTSFISLDVETHNQRALKLYTRLGFMIQNACDYWSIDLAQLEKMIQAV